MPERPLSRLCQKLVAEEHYRLWILPLGRIRSDQAAAKQWRDTQMRHAIRSQLQATTSFWQVAIGGGAVPLIHRQDVFNGI